MDYDPDQLSDRPKEIADLDKVLAALQDCDLNEYDQDFVDDMVKKLGRYGSSLTLTARQQEHIETMKRRYHV